MKEKIYIDGEKTNYYIYDDGSCFNEKTNTFLKGSIKNTGYKAYLLTVNKNKKTLFVHRLVAEYFIPNPNNLPVVNHKDGNKLNNNVENLEWSTYSENRVHALKNNLTLSFHGKNMKYDGDLNNEVWKQYKNSNYYVSNFGRVKNIVNNNLIQGTILNGGYRRYSLRINNKTETVLAHILVFFTFNQIDRKDGYVVNHIDGNKLNNNIENLEYISYRDNLLHSQYVLSNTVKHCAQYNLKGEYIQSFKSLSEAARNVGGCNSAICQACKNKIKTYKGYIWKYE